MLTKKWIMEIFYLISSLSLTADTSIVHFFYLMMILLFLIIPPRGLFGIFFWIQFRLKLFVPSFFFPRITFFHVLLLSPWCASQWLWIVFCLRKRKVSSCSFAHCTFFVWIRHCIEAKKTKEYKKLIVNLLSLIVFLSIQN